MKVGFRSRRQAAWGMLSPTLLILVVVGVTPFVYILFYSVFDWNILALRGRIFAGLDNYRHLVVDPEFLRSLGRGLIFIALTCLIQLPLGYGIAVLLNRRFMGRGLVRALLVLPLAMAPVAIGALWILLTKPGIGPLPEWLGRLGINYNRGVNAWQAFATVVAMDTWQWTPFVALALLAGIASLPKDPFEAARIDGASSLQILRHITLPLLKPVILVVLFLRILEGFRIFDQVWMLTGGGPGHATRFVSIHLFQTVLGMQEFGYGSAMTVLVLYLTIVMCWLLLVIIKREES